MNIASNTEGRDSGRENQGARAGPDLGRVVRSRSASWSTRVSSKLGLLPDERAGLSLGMA